MKKIRLSKVSISSKEITAVADIFKDEFLGVDAIITKFQHEWLTQTFHVALMSSGTSVNGICAVAKVSKPSECVLSNKFASLNLSIFSIYLVYILFLFRLNFVRNIIIVDFDVVINDSAQVKTIADKFLDNGETGTLLSAEWVKISNLDDKPQDGNPLNFSAPTKEKEQEKAILRKNEQTHYFARVAAGLYFKLFKKVNWVENFREVVL